MKNGRSRSRNTSNCPKQAPLVTFHVIFWPSNTQREKNSEDSNLMDKNDGNMA